MRTGDVYKSMFFKMDASFKTSVKARKLSGSSNSYVKYIVNKRDGFIVVLLNLK